MAEQYAKPGDIVQLRSGGPEMTANDFKYGDLQCSWFVENELKEGLFSVYSLKVIEKHPNNQSDK